MKMPSFRSMVLLTTLGISTLASAQEPAKIHTGLRSADALLADMEYVTSKLAKQQNTFNKNIKPNIEIFLIGVNPQLPVGMTVLLSEDTGQRTMLQVPVLDLKDDFIAGNLNPIDIEADKDRKDKTLYKLSGNAYDGWMRAKGNDSYASISKLATDVPATIPSPDVTLKALFDKGYDAVAFGLNTAAEAKTRTAAFQTLKKNRISALKKNSDETEEAFNLRKLMITQQMDSLGQLFSESQLFEAGWTTDEAKKIGHGESHWTALPETGFAKWMTRLEAEKSVFASSVVHEKSVFSARVLTPISEVNLANLKEVYRLSPTVLKQQIEKEEGLSAEEKSARGLAIDAGLEALNKNLDMGVVDMFLDTFPAGDKHHFVLGFRSVDNREAIEKLVEQLGKARNGWTSKTNLETVGETRFHSFSVNNAPQILLDFYGGDGTVYVAAGPKFIGFATGVGSLESLKKLAEVAAQGEAKPLENFVDVRFQARESLQVFSAFMDEKDFDLLKVIQQSGLALPKQPTKTGDKPKEKKAGGGSASEKLSALKNFDWHKTAIDAMQGTNDNVLFQIKLLNGSMDGKTEIQEGVLTGAGAVISKFAKENLGGN